MSNIYHFIHEASETYSTLKEYYPSYKRGKDSAEQETELEMRVRQSDLHHTTLPKAHCYPHEMLPVFCS